MTITLLDLFGFGVNREREGEGEGEGHFGNRLNSGRTVLLEHLQDG
jgi:hypothetical protein